jgi:pimeloyl-ACP methyl ester carboxylesterase
VSADAARLDVAGLVGAPSFAAARDDFSRYRLRSADAAGALSRIPVTVAWGTRDRILIHRTQSARARAVMPYVRHVDLPGCGHLPFNDDPELCAQLVLESGITAVS